MALILGTSVPKGSEIVITGEIKAIAQKYLKPIKITNKTTVGHHLRRHICWNMKIFYRLQWLLPIHNCSKYQSLFSKSKTCCNFWSSNSIQTWVSFYDVWPMVHRLWMIIRELFLFALIFQVEIFNSLPLVSYLTCSVFKQDGW